MAKEKALQKRENTLTQKDVEINERYIAPDVDIYETNSDYVILADLPGVSKERLSIKLDRNDLSITGNTVKSDLSKDNILVNECCPASYHRHFTLPDDVDRNKIDAKLENGVLKITLSKKEDYKPRDIKIN